uniref:Integrase, catalytic region, zinc finger, CCHC-type, peptidase aspartic, catalytic n=1 Tax=Tanacetum cinerariifolium TaxID=118510 RepID=A0A6L2LDC7_TANCI|nr:integrase, catalytic region, zinc finger, CCHC-type, peptidase aspartic, catalytic [Tanacetum cinerariifolium]
MTKVIKREFEKHESLKISNVSLTCNTSLEIFNKEFNQMSRMDDDLFTYEVEIADITNILCDLKKEDDSKQQMSHESDDDMECDPSNVEFTEWLEVMMKLNSPTKNSLILKMTMKLLKFLASRLIWRDDGYCNGGNLPGAYIVRNALRYQVFKWYEALKDGKIKEEALENNVVIEGIIEDEDDESSNEDKERCELFDDHDQPVCNIRRFKMIKYLFRQDEEYVPIKEDESDDLTSIREDACQTLTYQEIFRMMDEGWMEDTTYLCLHFTKDQNGTRINTPYPGESIRRIQVMVIQILFWIVDSGYSKHMTGNLKLLINFVEKFMRTICFGNDNFFAIIGYGDYVQGNLTICHAYYVECLRHNLFSVAVETLSLLFPCWLSYLTLLLKIIIANTLPPGQIEDLPEDEPVHPESALIIPHHAPMHLEKEPELDPEFAPFAQAVPDNMNDVDDENKMDDPEIINPYEEVDSLNQPPPDFDSELDDGSSATAFTTDHYKVFALRPMGRNYDALHSKVNTLTRQMKDGSDTKFWILRRFDRSDLHMNSFDDDSTVLDSTLREQILSRSKMEQLVTDLSRQFQEMKEENARVENNELIEMLKTTQ